jgi:hypothetical protein
VSCRWQRFIIGDNEKKTMHSFGKAKKNAKNI